MILTFFKKKVWISFIKNQFKNEIRISVNLGNKISSTLYLGNLWWFILMFVWKLWVYEIIIKKNYRAVNNCMDKTKILVYFFSSSSHYYYTATKKNIQKPK